MRCEIWHEPCCKFTAESNSETIFKIGQHFSKLWKNIDWHAFYGSQCMYVNKLCIWFDLWFYIWFVVDFFHQAGIPQDWLPCPRDSRNVCAHTRGFPSSPFPCTSLVPNSFSCVFDSKAFRTIIQSVINAMLCNTMQTNGIYTTHPLKNLFNHGNNPNNFITSDNTRKHYTMNNTKCHKYQTFSKVHIHSLQTCYLQLDNIMIHAENTGTLYGPTCGIIRCLNVWQ